MNKIKKKNIKKNRKDFVLNIEKNIKNIKEENEILNKALISLTKDIKDVRKEILDIVNIISKSLFLEVVTKHKEILDEIKSSKRENN